MKTLGDTIALIVALLGTSSAFICACMLYIKNRKLDSAQKRNDAVFQQSFLQDDEDIVSIVRQLLKSGKGVSREMAIIKAMIARDSAYAWSWYCNLVMAFVDEGCDKVTAMKGAARFLNILANIDVTKDVRYQEEIQRLQDPDLAVLNLSSDMTRPGPLM